MTRRTYILGIALQLIQRRCDAFDAHNTGAKLAGKHLPGIQTHITMLNIFNERVQHHNISPLTIFLQEDVSGLNEASFLAL
jgi:hypothetical protein